MLTPRYRKAAQADVRASDDAPGSLRSRLLGSFLILGCGVFGVVFLATQNMRAFDGRPGSAAIVAGIIAGTLFSLSLYSILSHHRHVSGLQRRLGDAGAEPVEMLEVRGVSRVLDIGAPGSTGPALCFELPDGQILLLYRQWLMEHTLYRAPRPVDDGNQDHFNTLDSPHAFPSDHFVIHRWRGEDRPFWIEVRGGYLPPVESAVQLRPGAKVRELELFAGSVETLQEDIDRAFGGKGAGGKSGGKAPAVTS